MKREFHVRFCESLKGGGLGATRPGDYNSRSITTPVRGLLLITATAVLVAFEKITS